MGDHERIGDWRGILASRLFSRAGFIYDGFLFFGLVLFEAFLFHPVNGQISKWFLVTTNAARKLEDGRCFEPSYFFVVQFEINSRNSVRQMLWFGHTNNRRSHRLLL